jgi:hypothetical protein
MSLRTLSEVNRTNNVFLDSKYCILDQFVVIPSGENGGRLCSFLGDSTEKVLFLSHLGLLLSCSLVNRQLAVRADEAG